LQQEERRKDQATKSEVTKFALTPRAHVGGHGFNGTVFINTRTLLLPNDLADGRFTRQGAQHQNGGVMAKPFCGFTLWRGFPIPGRQEALCKHRRRTRLIFVRAEATMGVEEFHESWNTGSKQNFMAKRLDENLKKHQRVCGCVEQQVIVRGSACGESFQVDGFILTLRKGHATYALGHLHW
jgi:hypothetical protein